MAPGNPEIVGGNSPVSKLLNKYSIPFRKKANYLS